MNKTTNAMRLGAGLRFDYNKPSITHPLLPGPGSRASRNRHGRVLRGSKEGVPFQDSRGQWYVRDAKGTLRRCDPLVE